MSKKVLLVSDNHFNKRILNKLTEDFSDMNYYLHLGDSEMYEDELKHFISVRGNNDFDQSYPKERVITINDHNVFMTHGHHYISLGRYDLLIKRAKELACDVVFFGHTHRFTDVREDGIRLINPGSCSHNRDGSPPSFGLLTFEDDGKIDLKRYNIKI